MWKNIKEIKQKLKEIKNTKGVYLTGNNKRKIKKCFDEIQSIIVKEKEYTDKFKKFLRNIQDFKDYENEILNYGVYGWMGTKVLLNNRDSPRSKLYYQKL